MTYLEYIGLKYQQGIQIQNMFSCTGYTYRIGRGEILFPGKILSQPSLPIQGMIPWRYPVGIHLRRCYKFFTNDSRDLYLTDG